VSGKEAVSNILIVLCLICVVSLVGVNAAETAKIHRTGVGSPNAFLFVAGVEKGFYGANGIDALTVMAQPQVGVQGLIGGSFDFSQILGSTTTAIMRGAALKIVMVFDRRPLFWLFSAPEIKRLKDLKGKVVAIQTLGGASGHMTRELLAQNGIDWQRDVTIQVIPLEARLTALSSGAVAATVVNAPERARANKLGFNELGFYGDHFEYASGGIAVTEKTLTERRDFVTRFLRASLQTFQWYKGNEKEVISMFARFSKLPEEDAGSIYRASLNAYTEDGTLSRESQERIINLHKNEVKIDKDFSPERIFDFTILRSVVNKVAKQK